MSEDLKVFIESKIEGQQLSIVNLDGGGALELIDLVLNEVVQNCCDINREFKFKREVNFKMIVTPLTERRDTVKITYSATPKLAKYVPISEEGEYKISGGINTPFIESKMHQEQLKIFDFKKKV